MRGKSGGGSSEWPATKAGECPLRMTWFAPVRKCRGAMAVVRTRTTPKEWKSFKPFTSKSMIHGLYPRLGFKKEPAAHRFFDQPSERNALRVTTEMLEEILGANGLPSLNVRLWDGT